MARGAHKVHPIGFRLGINKNWKSRWFAKGTNYGDLFLSDNELRKVIEEKIKNAGVASVVIKRSMSKISIDVEVARPGVVIGKGGEAINKLRTELSRVAKQPVDIKILEVKKPEIVAKLVAESIAMQCERRVLPKIAAQRAIDAAMATNSIEGIAIWIRGRIRGAEIANIEKYQEGNVPRHTIRKNIDYAFVEAQVPAAGKHGIKVWINKGEKNSYSID
ncbi:MAG: 30S ribosomal protein S3 [Candidatus Dojkabacteria bacterium]|nr:MAG: 30S ribosomal protein S3 [Candidatus Dojkabacteria bacterium]